MTAIEVDHYYERVAAALADLPPETRDELLEDLPAHFAEVLQEQGGPLIERLGPPAVYAAELRAAAGLDAAPVAASADRVPLAVYADRAKDWLRRTDHKLGPMLGYARLADFLRLLRPAWWLARGALIVVLLFALDILPRDRFDDPLGVLLVVAAAVLSVRIGATGRPRVPRWVGFAVTSVAVVGALFVLANAPGLLRQYTSQEYVPAYDRWSNVTDVYPVDEHGRPLENVTLYDQNGNVIQIGEYWRCIPDGQKDDWKPTYPLCRGPRFDPTIQSDPTLTPTPSLSPQPAASSLSPTP